MGATSSRWRGNRSPRTATGSHDLQTGAFSRKIAERKIFNWHSGRMGRIAGEGGAANDHPRRAPTKPRRSVNPDFDISYLRRRSEHNISRGERTIGREGRRRWNRQEGERRREFLGSFNNLASSFSDSYRRDYIPWINILTPIFVAGARATPRPTGKRNKLRAELLNHSRPRPYKRS